MNRAAWIERTFGIAAKDDPYGEGLAMKGENRIELVAGRIVLITGGSGSGKSTLLRRLRRRYARARWLDLGRAPLPDRMVVDLIAETLPAEQFPDEESRTIAALEALSRFGLGEAWTYLRRPAQLSEGQRWRLRLAVALAEMTGHRRPSRADTTSQIRSAGGVEVLAGDDFCCLLDRISAVVVARALRRAVDRIPGLCTLLATSRDDLEQALEPDVVIRCDYGVSC